MNVYPPLGFVQLGVLRCVGEASFGGGWRGLTSLGPSGP